MPRDFIGTLYVPQNLVCGTSNESGSPRLASGNNVKAVRSVLYVYGTSDPESTVDQVEHVVGLMPRAELHFMGLWRTPTVVR